MKTKPLVIPPDQLKRFVPIKQECSWWIIADFKTGTILKKKDGNTLYLKTAGAAERICRQLNTEEKVREQSEGGLKQL